MELPCLQNDTTITSRLDPKLIEDERFLKNLLDIEEHFLPNVSYFTCVQTEVRPFMRRRLATWMLEVCENNCEDGVLTLAVNYLDRFLTVVPTRKGDLQLIGAVCLFLASKLREARRLTAEQLCAYTDNAINPQTLLQWELLVVEKLNWDLAAVVPNDYIELIVRKLPLPCDKLPLIRTHVQALLALCATDFSFAMYPPSMLAAASIAAAIRELQLNGMDQSLSGFSPLDLLAKMINTETDCLKSCQEQIESFLVTSSWDGQPPIKRARGDPDTEGLSPPALSCTPADVRDVDL